MNARELMANVREGWLNLSSGQRRVLTFACIIFVVATAYYAAMPERKNRDKNEQKPAFVFSQPDMAAEVMAEKLENRIIEQRTQMRAMQERMEQLETAVKKPGPSPAGVQSHGGAAMLREMERTLGGAEVVPGGEVPFAPAPRLETPTPETPPAAPAPKETTGQPDQAAAKLPRSSKNEEDASVPPRSLGVLSWEPPQPENTGQEEKEKQEPEGFYVPSSTFFDVSLLTGLDAPTGTKAKNQPSPLALRIQDLSWLPNEYRQNVRGCFILAEGIGELSTERVSVRGISISCVDDQGQMVLDQKLLGYVADADGKAGLRGEVVSKAGKLLAQTMTVGFIQGLSQFFTFTSRDFVVTDSGSINSSPTDRSGDYLAGGMASGIGTALEKVSDYYMDLAEEVFPVIQVGATRAATFVVTQGVELRFDKSLNLKPEQKDTEHDL